MEAFLDPNWPSEATSKASVIKYANEEGPRSITYPTPPKIFNLGRQCERETGRASQADDNGVGGYKGTALFHDRDRLCLVICRWFRGPPRGGVQCKEG